LFESILLQAAADEVVTLRSSEDKQNVLVALGPEGRSRGITSDGVAFCQYLEAKFRARRLTSMVDLVAAAEDFGADCKWSRARREDVLEEVLAGGYVVTENTNHIKAVHTKPPTISYAAPVVQGAPKTAVPERGRVQSPVSVRPVESRKRERSPSVDSRRFSRRDEDEYKDAVLRCTQANRDRARLDHVLGDLSRTMGVADCEALHQQLVDDRKLYIYSEVNGVFVKLKGQKPKSCF
jgi:hypothetical protein